MTLPHGIDMETARYIRNLETEKEEIERKLAEMRTALELSLLYVNGKSKQSQNIRQKVLNALSREK